MSGKKLTQTNVHRQVREERNANWAVQQRNRENERRIRENEIIANQIAASQARTRQDISNLQSQILYAERRAAAERARLAEMNQQALQEIAGIQVDLQVTQDMVQDMQWENQELHRLAAQDRAQIKTQIEQAREENLQWHRIAQAERDRINTQVQRNEQLINQNRSEIEKNRQALKEGLDAVMREVEFQGDRRVLDEMRNAASVLETTILSRANIPTEWMELFDPENYHEAQKLMSAAERHFQAGNYTGASEVAGQALNKMTTVAANVNKKQKDHQRAREEAFRYYDELQETIKKLDTDRMAHWYAAEFSALKSRVKELEDIARADKYFEVQIDEYRELREKSQDLLNETVELGKKLDETERKHFERRENAKSFVRALATQGDYRPIEPIFENPSSAHSDVLLQTEEGLTMRLALDGEVITEFPEGYSPEENDRWMEKFSQTCQKQGFAQIGYERIQ